jgi:hypothetical protein
MLQTTIKGLAMDELELVLENWSQLSPRELCSLFGLSYNKLRDNGPVRRAIRSYFNDLFEEEVVTYVGVNELNYRSAGKSAKLQLPPNITEFLQMLVQRHYKTRIYKGRQCALEGLYGNPIVIQDNNWYCGYNWRGMRINAPAATWQKAFRIACEVETNKMKGLEK